jgi:hypothetical protein
VTPFDQSDCDANKTPLWEAQLNRHAADLPNAQTGRSPGSYNDRSCGVDLQSVTPPQVPRTGTPPFQGRISESLDGVTYVIS